MKRKIVSAVLCTAMVISVGSTVKADVTKTESGDSIIVDCSDGAGDTSTTQDVTVTAQKGSTFSVCVPKHIEMTDKEYTYKVGVYADMTPTQSVKVAPVDGISETADVIDFVLKNDGGKPDAKAVITPVKTVWNYGDADICAAEADAALPENMAEAGKITADVSAGTWTGTFTLNIGMEDTAQQAATLEAGLYDANGTMLCSWDDSGIDVEKDYETTTYQTETTTVLYALTNTYPTATKLVIPDGVTKIGEGALADCAGLTSVTLPDSVTSIGKNAFIRCTGLTSFTIPSSVTSIGKSAFMECTNLTSVTFETTDGWYVGMSAGAKTNEVSSDDMKNVSETAKRLTTQTSLYWTR